MLAPAFKLCVAGAMITCSLVAFNVLADDAWTELAVQNVDLASEALVVDRAWSGGVLRVALSSATVLPNDWRIDLNFGDRTMRFDATNSASRVVAPKTDRQVMLDLPLRGPAQVRADVSPTNLRLRIVAVIYPSRVRSQQMIGPERRIDLFNDGVGERERSIGPAFGRLHVFAGMRLVGICTAFRIEVRYWLTAAHCIARDRDDPLRPAVTALRLQPHDYAAGEPEEQYSAVPVASGQANGRVNAQVFLEADDLDYALLHVQDDPGGPVFALSSAIAVKENAPLQLFQHWAGQFGPYAGKARSADASCILYERWGNDPTKPSLCPNAFQHGCSSQPGASGGPLVDRTTLRLIGLHYGAGKPSHFNCALPAHSISNHLCSTNNELAKGLTTCEPSS